MRSTVASQQEGCGFKSRMVQDVRACSRAFLCGVCVFTRVPPIEPYNNKNMQKEEMLISPVPDQDRTGHLDLVPGRRIAGCPLLLAFPGGGCQDGLKAEDTFHRLHLTACVCVCVCVCCVSPLTPLTQMSSLMNVLSDLVSCRSL